MISLEKQNLYQKAQKILSNREKELFSLSLTIQGIVQGVGFRPFVYRIAKKYALKGEVGNNSHGVEIKISGERNAIFSFLLELEKSPPPLSVIREVSMQKLEYIPYSCFQIKESKQGHASEIDITPDIATCSYCLEEMEDSNNFRYQYPFINCTDCGPRYSIIQDLPYDRPVTTMKTFPMCERCKKEYYDPGNRRFHAQPIACPECGPSLNLLDAKTGKILENMLQENLIQEACKMLEQGKILAIKGLGGFHLACLADSPLTINILRERKKRDKKPFAVMVKDLSVANKIAYLSREEENILASFAKPIVLVKRKENTFLACDLLAPKLNTLGIMLPYTPLHHLLFKLGKFEALIMTSANVSDEPMIYQDEECLHALKNIADFFLTHNRKIENRVDDSLVRVVNDRPLFLRRARGYTPESLPSPLPVQGILACGGVLKSTIAIGRGNRCYVSPYIGKMENLETYHSLEQTTKNLLHLLKIQPKLVACDLHPDSLGSKFAKRYCQESKIPVVYIQHHHAHAASCMAENNFPPEQKAICVVYDGTGYGEDGSIWGGEIFLANYQSYQRVAHLIPVPLPGADLAIKEPWRIAMGFLFKQCKNEVKSLFPQIEESKKNAVWELLEANVSCPLSSSMGRLFDALSALLNINLKMEYEGQPAMELEALANTKEKGEYFFSIQETNQGCFLFDGVSLLLQAIEDIKKKISASYIASCFHNSIAHATSEMVYKIAKFYGISQIFLSGGCFQNALLLQKTIAFLEEKGLNAQTHRLLSPNDEGISYGQAVIAAAKQ